MYIMKIFIIENSKRDIFKLLETAISESSFIFDYLLYKQADEMAMGSPLLSPTLANIFYAIVKNDSWIIVQST